MTHFMLLFSQLPNSTANIFQSCHLDVGCKSKVYSLMTSCRIVYSLIGHRTLMFQHHKKFYPCPCVTSLTSGPPSVHFLGLFSVSFLAYFLLSGQPETQRYAPWTKPRSTSSTCATAGPRVGSTTSSSSLTPVQEPPNMHLFTTRANRNQLCAKCGDAH